MAKEKKVEKKKDELKKLKDQNLTEDQLDDVTGGIPGRPFHSGEGLPVTNPEDLD